jgi:hypothetical protein
MAGDHRTHDLFGRSLFSKLICKIFETMLLTSGITHTLIIVCTDKVGVEVSYKFPDF